MRRGMSLLEVVVAVTVLSGVLFTVGVIIPRAYMHSRNKGFQALAANLAENVIDFSRGLDPNLIPNGTYDGTKLLQAGGVPDPPIYLGQGRQFPPAPYPSQTVGIFANGPYNSVAYYFKVTVERPAHRVGLPPPATLREIEVTVYWYEPGQTSLQSFTVLSEIGP